MSGPHCRALMASARKTPTQSTDAGATYMAGKFARSWALMKASATVLRSDKSLLVFPLLSGLCTLLVAASFLIPVAVMVIATAALARGEAETVEAHTDTFAAVTSTR